MPFIPSTREIEIDRFRSSLVYRLASRTARATRRNPVSKHQNSNNKHKQTKNHSSSEKPGRIASKTEAKESLGSD